MKPNPKVSFCFTTYKRYDILKDTLQSVANQTFSDFEVIVSDNDPEQSGKAIVAEFDSQFKYFPNDKNLGMKKSFNKSLERSSGEFIVMIADDDPVYPDMLETLIQLSDKYPGYGMYLGGCNWFCTDPDLADFYNCKVGTNSGLAYRPLNEVQQFDGNSFLRNFFNFKIFPNYLWSTAIVRRDVLVGNGGVPDYGTAFLGNYAYMSIMGGAKGCVTINRALGHQTLHKQNFGRDQNQELLFVGDAFINYVSSKLSFLPEWDSIKNDMEHFVAVWLVRHMAFLKEYSKHTKQFDKLEEIKACENDLTCH